MGSRFSKSLTNKLQSVAKSKTGRIAFPILGIFLVLQIYFFQELLAAELLFGVAFAVLVGLVGSFYLIGTIGERGLNKADVAARAIGRSARRGYGAIEEMSKKSVRHPESAQ